MKIRHGFVTNSSSSSFVVAMKRWLSRDEMKAKISGVFGLDKSHPLYGFSQEIVAAVVNEINYAERYTPDDIDNMRNWYGDTYASILIQYGNLAIGAFGDDGEPAERWLCENDLNYEDDDILIVHNGGY